MAMLLDTHLHTMEYSMDSDLPVRDAVARAREMGAAAGIEVVTKILQGHPADKIAEESAGHDLCVCGSLGRTNAKRAVIGSVAEKVVRLAYCPVLVCRKNQE